MGVVYKVRWILATVVASALVTLAIQCEKGSDLKKEVVLELQPDHIEFDAVRSTATVKVNCSGDFTVEADASASGWCTVKSSSSSISVAVAENPEINDRFADIRVKSRDCEKTVSVSQSGATPIVTVSPDEIVLDYIDDEFTITADGNVDYDVVTSDSWISPVSESDGEGHGKVFVFRCDINDTENARTSEILFRYKNIEGQTSLSITQKARPSGYVEGEYDTSMDGVSDIFADDLFSVLKPGVTLRQIYSLKNEFYRNIAAAIFENEYDEEFRVQSYTPYEPLESLREWMKTSDYNRYENPTGIYFPEGNKAAIIFVGDTQGHKLSLRVKNYSFGAENETDYPLNEGFNKLLIRHPGLGYIAYYVQDFKTAPDVAIHIASGKVNGYYDKSRHTDDDWNRLINNTVYDFFDLKGDCVNLCYSAEGLRRYCPAEGYELIDGYDKLIGLQWDIMGLYKYNRVPKNHMFGRRVSSGFFADGIGAGFDYDGLCRVSTIMKDDVWGIAHEFGHVNQIRPGLKWVSTTEVTNNIYSVCSRYVYNREYMNLEMERLTDFEGNSYTGARYGSFLNSAIRDGDHWLTQRGPDQTEAYTPGKQRDHFVKLIPLWQLLMYYRYMPDASWYHPDWYGEIAEMVRSSSWYDSATNGELQMKFLMNVMDVVQADLSDFFIAVGMLTPIDEDAMDDYARAPMVITQAMCDEVIAYGKKYPEPATPVLYYLSYFSMEAFAKNLPVEGAYGQGVSAGTGNRLIVSGEAWKNVAVFEAYEADELKYITMVNSGDASGKLTYVIYPQGCTRLEAVGADGKRVLVYGER